MARPLGMSVEAAALGIHRVLNAQMAEGIRQVSVRQGIDPRTLRAGAARRRGRPARHRARKRTRHDARSSCRDCPACSPPRDCWRRRSSMKCRPPSRRRSTRLDLDAMRAADPRSRCTRRRAAASEQVAPEDVTVSHFADVCFIGQSYTLEIPLDPARPDVAERLYEDFLVAHDRVYGHAFRAPAKITALRAVHQAGGSETLEEMRLVPSGQAGRSAAATDPRLRASPAAVEARVLARDAMTAGFRVLPGPRSCSSPTRRRWSSRAGRARRCSRQSRSLAAGGRDA